MVAVCHLWLGNYSVDYGDCLKIKKPNGINEKNIRLLIKENIKMYDLKNTNETINNANGFILEVQNLKY